MLTVERNGTLFPDALPYCLFVKTEGGWFWDTGERFDSVSGARDFVSAEFDDAGVFHLVPMDKARIMADACLVEDFMGE